MQKILTKPYGIESTDDKASKNYTHNCALDTIW